MPSEPSARPYAVHENAQTSVTSASAGTTASVGWKSSRKRERTNPNAETTSPFTITGSARPTQHDAEAVLADQDVRAAEHRAHPDRVPRVAAAECGPADRAHAPGRRQHPADRPHPAG